MPFPFRNDTERLFILLMWWTKRELTPYQIAKEVGMGFRSGWLYKGGIDFFLRLQAAGVLEPIGGNNGSTLYKVKRDKIKEVARGDPILKRVEEIIDDF